MTKHMKKLMTNIVAMGIAIGLTCAAAPAGEATTATVNVTITVLPFASVTLEDQIITIPKVPNHSRDSGEGTFTVTCNCQTTITAFAVKPSSYDKKDEFTVSADFRLPGGTLFDNPLVVSAGANNAPYILRITGINADGETLPAENMAVSVGTPTAPATPGTAWIVVSTN